MKKILTILLAMILLLALAACGSETSAHSPGPWTVDLEGHSRVCTDCGETLDQGEHTLKAEKCPDCGKAENPGCHTKRDYVCTDCGVKIADLEEFTSLELPDEFGNPILMHYYTPWDDLIETWNCNYTYDTYGNMRTMEVFYNDALYIVKTCAAGRYGCLHDFSHNVETLTFYEPDGTVSSYKENTLYVDGSVQISKEYEDGVLVLENEYGRYGPGITYLARTTAYLEDGTRRITEYDEDGYMLSDRMYNADGSSLNHRPQFDAEACSELTGTWTGTRELDISEHLDGEEALMVAANVTLTFDGSGGLHYFSKVDPELYRETLVDALYDMYARVGLNRVQAEDRCYVDHGIDLAEYAEQILYYDGEGDPYADRELVYFVEDGVLYIAADWDRAATAVRFQMEGDSMTLTLVKPTEDSRPVTVTRNAG